MTTPLDDVDHLVKIDPDKTLVEDETYEDVCATGTDGIIVGGTTGITAEKMERVVDACAAYDIPLYQEPSNPAAVIEHTGLDGIFIPTVLNAGDVMWITGAHKDWVNAVDVDWSQITSEAYIVLNPDSSVATYTQADCELNAADVAAYAEIAEQLFGQSIVYIEYSGMFGDEAIVDAASDALDSATLFYGGGIHDYDSALTMAQHADTIIVGDLVHDEGTAAVEETVDGVRDA